MYAADIHGGRIFAINLNTSSVTVLYRSPDGLQPYTVAVSPQYIYFSAWNRKSVCVLLRSDIQSSDLSFFHKRGPLLKNGQPIKL